MRFFRSLSALCAATLVLIPISADATNGMFLIGYGAKSRSMGGVGIGYTQDSIGNHMNPAGITSLDIGGARMDVSAMLFYPRRSATLPDGRNDPPEVTGTPITYKSGSNLFVIPSMGGVYKFNRKLFIGFSFVGSGGGNTRYTKLSPKGYNFLNVTGNDTVGDTLGVNLAQAQMSPTLAYRINKQHTVAVSPVFAIQTFRAYGLDLFQAESNYGDSVSNNGNDWSYGGGVRFGWQGRPFGGFKTSAMLKSLTVGATYSSRLYMTEFDKYKGLFAESGDFDTPANFGVGLSLNLTDDLTLAFDWQRVYYSDIASINDPVQAISTQDESGNYIGKLGLPDGAGFGWEDQNIYKLGMKYRYNDEWDFMLGWNYGENQIPKDQLLFSTLAPAVTQHHLTMGTTYKPDKAIEWTLAYVHAFKKKASGLADTGGSYNQFFPDTDPNSNEPGAVELEMVQDSIEVSFTYKM